MKEVTLVSTSWTKKEDEQLLRLLKKGIKKGWSLQHLFLFMGQTLQRTPEECMERLQMLIDRERWGEIEERVVRLEQKLKGQQAQLEKLKKDMKFYELLLLEEYHILLRLLGEDSLDIRIHQI